MRIWCRLLWMVITFLFVACNMKKETPAPLELGVPFGSQSNSTNHSSSMIVDDSVVAAVCADDMVDSAFSRSKEVAVAEPVSKSNVNHQKLATKTSEETLMSNRNKVVPTISDKSLNLADSLNTITPSVEGKMETVDVIDTINLIDENIATEELLSDSLVADLKEQGADSLDYVSDTLFVQSSVVNQVLEESSDTCLSENKIDQAIEDYIVQRGLIHREANKSLFIPKGQWILGGQVGWNQWDNENVSYLLLENLSFEGHSFSAGPYLGYAFAKNMAVGCRFSYKRGYLNVDEVGLGLGDGLSLALTDFYSLYHSYKSSLFLRSYMPIGESKVFGLFGELQLNHNFTEGKCSVGRDELLRGVYANTYSLGLGLGGGMVVFLTDFAAAEVMLNVGGCDFKWGYQNIKEIDKKDNGRLNSSSADFRLDLFSIKFGLTFYL